VEPLGDVTVEPLGDATVEPLAGAELTVELLEDPHPAPHRSARQTLSAPGGSLLMAGSTLA
jgi:hypothetical protein